jgi:hypothetical protein
MKEVENESEDDKDEEYGKPSKKISRFKKTAKSSILKTCSNDKSLRSKKGKKK